MPDLVRRRIWLVNHAEEVWRTLGEGRRLTLVSSVTGRRAGGWQSWLRPYWMEGLEEEVRSRWDRGCDH